MHAIITLRWGTVLAVLGLHATVVAQEILPTTGITFPVLGRITPRAAKEIAASNWSVGGETLDRDFTVYDHYKKFLGPLGAKAIRVQTGWAKIEKTRGVYEWAWLDAVVDDARAQGVQPWLEINYGNKIYPGGGDTGLGGGVPTSPEALAAWDRWSRALVRRYKNRITDWEIWNEPDINRAGTAGVAAFTELFVRTATMIREEQPKGRIFALGLAGNMKYAEDFLGLVQQRGKLDLIDAITVHGYPRNPDDTGTVDKLRAVIAKFGRAIEVRQGETGAPSKFQESFALSKIPWTETSQAKWDLRRMLAHRAKDVPYNLFTISDMHYRKPDGTLQMNYKGLLATNPDQTISHVKPMYRAAQHVFAIFDDSVQRIADYPFTANVTSPRKLALTGYTQRPGGRQIAALWFSDATVTEDNATTPVDITLAQGKFQKPVLVDLRTGLVYEIPAGQWTRSAGGATFRGLPVYDSPLLVAESAALRFVPGKL